LDRVGIGDHRPAAARIGAQAGLIVADELVIDIEL